MSTKVLKPRRPQQSLAPRRGDASAIRKRRADASKRPAVRRGPLNQAPSRLHGRQHANLRIADVVIDLVRQQVTRAGKVLDLTARDLELLAFLVRHAGTTLSRERLARAIWKRAHSGRSNFVEVAMWRLRSKLDGPYRIALIHAVRGVGYVCTAPR
jgi:two-component system copper resistance phosphate regulon response regulator CusR